MGADGCRRVLMGADGCRRVPTVPMDAFCSTHLLCIQLRTAAQGIVLSMCSACFLPHGSLPGQALTDTPRSLLQMSLPVAFFTLWLLLSPSHVCPVHGQPVRGSWAVWPPVGLRESLPFLCPCCLCKARMMSCLDKSFPFLPGDEFQGYKLRTVSLPTSLLGPCPACSSQHASLPFQAVLLRMCYWACLLLFLSCVNLGGASECSVVCAILESVQRTN